MILHLLNISYERNHQCHCGLQPLQVTQEMQNSLFMGVMICFEYIHQLILNKQVRCVIVCYILELVLQSITLLKHTTVKRRYTETTEQFNMENSSNIFVCSVQSLGGAAVSILTLLRIPFQFILHKQSKLQQYTQDTMFEI